MSIIKADHVTESTVGAGVTIDKLLTASLGVNLGGVANLLHYEEGSWTPVPSGLTVVGTPTYVGSYIRVGKLVFCTLRISSTTSTASTHGTTSFTGLPVAQNTVLTTCNSVDNASTVSYGNGLVSASTVFTPTWGASADVVVDFMYETT